MTRCRALALAVVLALLVTGCGDDAPTADEDAGGPTTSEPGPPAVWEEQRVALGRGADTEPLTGVDGDRIVMVTATDEGVLQSAVATGDGPFETGPPLDTGLELLFPGGLARHDDAWWVVAQGGTRPVPERPDDWELTHDLHVFTSADGLTWEAVEATGIDGPGRVEDLVATADGLAAIGHDEGPNVDPEAGFTALAWHSTDGATWEQVEIPDLVEEDQVRALVAIDDELLAVGDAGGRPAQWRSTDGGATWAAEEPAGLPDGVVLGDVEVVGGALLASGSGPNAEEGGHPPVMARSTDGGRTWSEAPQVEVEDAEGFGAPLIPIGDRALALVSSFFEPWSDPAVCYADIAQCRNDQGVSVLVGDGVDPWQPVDLSGLGLDQYDEIGDAVATEDRLVLTSAGETEVRTWSTPADATLPTAPAQEVERADVTLLEEGDRPEVGVTYAAPLYIHCGMQWLYLGSEPYERIDTGPDTETGAGDEIDPSWPVAFESIYGFATLGEDGVVEYTIGDGEVIATYADTTTQPPGCM